jgi:hypothetical protein
VVTLFEKHGERGLNAGNTTPDLEEIDAALQLERGWRMVGPDDPDAAIQDALPKVLALRDAPQRRSAFGNCSEPFHILRSEKQIVRARLN